MKAVIKYIIVAAIAVFALNTYAQDIRTIVNEGIALNAAHNYAGALEKYKTALALEPNNINANYQSAVSLNAIGKPADALPYLEKVIALNASPSVIASAHALMGSIYDKTKQRQKAIVSYKHAVSIDSANNLSHYNLGLAYFRAKQYAYAENSALNALAIDAKHPGSLRLYALVTFHQDKRAPALLALCRFLSVDPTGQSSAEAYGNLQSILKGGALKAEPGVKTPIPDSHNRALNSAIITAVQSVDKAKYPTTTALLAQQLDKVFTQLGQLVERQNGHSQFFADITNHYYKLAQTDNMTAFATFISQNSNKSAAAWIKSHPEVNNTDW